jgi:hypothetical protein
MSTVTYPITSVGEGSYSNPEENRPAEAIISSAYDEARRVFSTELNQDDCKQIWFNEKCTMHDVLKIVNDSKARYETRHTSKARDWLKVFSSRVAHYGVILDVFVQHHPEYVSLAWGTMKFLFMVGVSHSSLRTRSD